MAGGARAVGTPAAARLIHRQLRVLSTSGGNGPNTTEEGRALNRRVELVKR